MTNNDFVSRIIPSLRALNKDSHIPRRYILSLGRDIARTYIAQKLGERSINEEENLFSYINCLEFSKEELVKCNIIEFRRCDVLMKSIKKLPEIIFSRLGGSIKDITSLDGNFRFELVSIDQYRLNKNRSVKMANMIYVYYSSDGHLYIPDSEIYALDVKILTQQTEKIPALNSCKKQDLCKSGWDYDFIVPDKLSKPVQDAVLQTLMGSYKQIPPDENPNGTERE